MRNLFLFIVSVIVFASCRTIEPLTSKGIEEFSVEVTEYNFYTSNKMIFEHKYSKPSRRKEMDLYIEHLYLKKKCKVTENKGDTLIVEFKGNTFKFNMNSKGEFQIVENQDLEGQKFKLIDGKGAILMCKVKRKTIIKK